MVNRTPPLTDFITTKSLPKLEPLICIQIVLLIGVFLLLNLWTSLSFAPWADEVMQVDPGINLHLGKGWVSTAWQHQSQHEFWAANNPLFALLIYGWTSLFGIAPVAVRSLNYMLIAGIVWLITDACLRKELLVSRWSRMVLALLIVCDQAVTFVYRSGRADLATMLVIAGLFWIYVSVQESTRRNKLLFATALFIFPCGMQAVPYAVLLLGLDYIVSKKLRIPEILSIASGCAIGGLLMASIFLWQGSLKGYIAETATSGYNILGSALQALIIRDDAAISRFLSQLNGLTPKNVLNTVLRDNSLVPLIAFFGIAAIASQRGHPLLRSIALYGLVAAFLVPFGMAAAGRYAIYYGWMGAAPPAIAFVAALELCVREQRGRLMAGGILAAFASAVLGMPAEVLRQAVQTSPSAYNEVEDLLRKEVVAGDAVYGDPVLYYAAKKDRIPFYSSTYAGGRLYRSMSGEERSQVKVLIIRPEDFDEAVSKLGGDWKRTNGYYLAYGFQLGIWRR
jgi:hypothetical protein